VLLATTMPTRTALYRFAKGSRALWRIYGAYRAAVHAAVPLVPRRRNGEVLGDFRVGQIPTLSDPTSQLCTASQCDEAVYAQWCEAMRTPVRFGRKQWEHVFILEVLRRHRMIKPGSRGVGFGCGREPTVAILARMGCTVVATDLAPSAVAGRGWAESGQHASSLDALNEFNLCDTASFRERVTLRYVDMNAVPEDMRDFDFSWSSCALEHLGSLRHGFDFIKASLVCLKPGGIAVHTTEFNLSSNEATLEDQNCVVYRKRDIEDFIAECAKEGIEVFQPNWQSISSPLDEHVDREPYGTALNLKVRLARYVCTSIGLIFRKPQM
jgi:Methyltransferase domain